MKRLLASEVDALTAGVLLALDTLALDEAPPEWVEEVPTPRPPPLPVAIDSGLVTGPFWVLPGEASAPRPAISLHARRRERAHRGAPPEWSVPLVGEAEARAASARAQVAAAPEPYRDFHGRVRTYPPLESVQHEGLRRAVIAEMRRHDLAPGPSEPGYSEPPSLPRKPLAEATVLLERGPGEASFVDLWRALDQVKADAESSREAERAFRAWARRVGFAVSRKRRKRDGREVWSATARSPKALRAHGNAVLRADSLTALQAQLGALVGPPAEVPPPARRGRARVGSPHPAQLTLDLEGTCRT